MEKAMQEALQEYGRTIRKSGWKAGEPLIRMNAKRFKDFKKWARALAMMLRATELLKAGYPRS